MISKKSSPISMVERLLEIVSQVISRAGTPNVFRVRVHTSPSTFTPPQEVFQALEIALTIAVALSYAIFQCNRQKLASIRQVLGSSCMLVFAIAAPKSSLVSEE